MKFNANPQTGGGKHLKLKDKEQIICILRGNPQEFYATWDGSKFQECAEKTPKASFRFRINCIINENGAFTAKVFEQGATVYNLLKDLTAEYELEKTFIIIKRSGTGTDTSYSIMPSQKTKWDAKIAKQIEAVQLHEFGDKIDIDDSPAPDADEEIPF